MMENKTLGDPSSSYGPFLIPSALYLFHFAYCLLTVLSYTIPITLWA